MKYSHLFRRWTSTRKLTLIDVQSRSYLLVGKIYSDRLFSFSCNIGCSCKSMIGSDNARGGYRKRFTSEIRKCRWRFLQRFRNCYCGLLHRSVSCGFHAMLSLVARIPPEAASITVPLEECFSSPLRK